MQKPAFITAERASRLVVSLLFGAGVLMPLVMAFGLGAQLVRALVIFAAVVTAFVVFFSSKRGKFALALIATALAVVQLITPGMGFFGDAMEAFKAIALYFNNVQSAAAIFAAPIATLLAVCVALMSYAFTGREVGFLPAATLLVLTLFGVWSLGRQELLWYATPGLTALLLLVSQTSHGRVNLFEVMPMAALVVVLGMLLLPRGQTVIPPLYDAAMDLKQTISDYLFFTEPRNVFTLGSYGYYPMGSGKLGGEAEPSEYPVMIVKTDKSALMRAVVKDEYTGRSWRDTSSGKRYLYVNPRWAKLRESVFLETMPAQAVRSASTLFDERAISVQIQNNAASTVFSPVYLRGFNAQNDMVAYFNDASELFITRDLAPGDSYTVFTPVLEGGDADLGALIDAAPKGSDPYYKDALASYTGLPTHMEKKVFDDLADMVSGAGSPYEQACAIMRHLKRYYKYTLTPDTPPENQDFVTYFMYVGKEGYCTYFASAMTVLCRMAGMPARYIEGFRARPDGDGFAYVTGLNAHAWTEVYFEGFGWIPFDATPAQQDLDSSNNNNNSQPSPSPSPSPSPEPEPDPSPEPEDSPTPEPDDAPPSDDPSPQDDDPQDDSTPPNPFPWWILLVLAAIAALWVRISMRTPDHVAAKRTDERDKIFVYGNASYQLMRMYRRTPKSGETPLMFARRMDRQKAFPVPVLPLWRMLALSNYSRMKPGAEQTLRAKETFLRLYKPQRALKKLRFLIRAAFTRDFYTALDTRLMHTEPVKPYTYKLKQKGSAGSDAYKPRPGMRGGAGSADKSPPREAVGDVPPIQAPVKPQDAGVKPAEPSGSTRTRRRRSTGGDAPRDGKQS